MDDLSGQAETFAGFEYIPQQQGWRLRDTPSSAVRSLEDITFGAVFQRGPNIYRTGDSAYLGRVATVAGSTLEVGSMGTVLLNNRVPRSRVDDPLAVDRQPRAMVSGTLPGLGDVASLPINRVISLAPRGELVYVLDRPSEGLPKYQRVLAPAPGEPVPQRLSTGYRLATSEELLVRGVAGWLTRNASALVERLKLAGMEREDGTITNSGSEIVRLLALELDIQPVITYVLTGLGL